MKRNSKACRLLSTVLANNAWDEIARRGILASDFTEDAHIVYQWVARYLAKHNVLPSIQLVEDETGIELPDPCALEFAFEGFLDWLVASEIEARIRKINGAFSNGKFREAASYFQPIQIDRVPPRTFLSERSDRYQQYCDRKLRGIDGIDIPWPTLADTLIKWEKSTLNVLLAPSSAGKTWLACYIAAETMKSGKKVLFASLENTRQSIGKRLDSLIYKVPFEDMRTARADLRIEKDWAARLNSREFSGDIILMDRTEVDTVADIVAISQAENPDFIIIDGAYFLKGKGGTNWEKAADALNELQMACKMGDAPWLCSNQLKPKKDGKSASGYDLGYEARYASEWMLNPDTSFILLQDDDDRVFNRATIKIAKVREAGDLSDRKMEFEIHSNRVTMDFSEIIGEVEYDVDY